MSRGRTASIFIDNGLSSIIKHPVEDNYTANAPSLTDKVNGKSIIEVQATYLVFNLAKMVYVSWYIKKHYSWIDLSVTPDFKAISQKSAVMVHQISSLVFSHTDVLILTFVCGLKTVSIYSMYATIYGMVDNVINIINDLKFYFNLNT